MAHSLPDMRRALPIIVLAIGGCSTSSTSGSVTQPPGDSAAVDVASGTDPADRSNIVPASPTSEPSTAPSVVDSGAVFPSGFERVMARIVEPDGTVCELCLWLAETSDQRRRGLMSVTDLGGAEGMAFRYERPNTTRFWMKDTLLPLSIAFFGPDGDFIESFDMEPCLTPTCQRYPTPPDFLVAVETHQGELASIGMLEGSTLELLDLPCPT